MKLETIQTDKRGSINLLLDDLKTLEEVTIFITKSGYARGGCIHELHDEHCCVIEGEVAYYIGQGGYCCTILEMGDSIIIPKNTPHLFTSLTDSVVLEWGAIPAEKQCKHVEFRAIVDKINKEKDNDSSV